MHKRLIPKGFRIKFHSSTGAGADPGGGGGGLGG